MRVAPLLLAALVAAAGGQPVWDHCRTLDCRTGLRLRWTVSNGTLTAAMEAVTRGYMLVGVSGGGVYPLSAGTDGVLGWLGSEEDETSGGLADVTYASPTQGIELDARQDVQFLGLEQEQGGLARFTWQRSLDTGDPADRTIRPGSPQLLVWAVRQEPRSVRSRNGTGIHLFASPLGRGVEAVTWLAAPSECEPCQVTPAALTAELVQGSAAPPRPHGSRWLHIGGSERKEGWEVANIIDGPHVDHIVSLTDMGSLEDDSFSRVYASHVLEHVAYQGELALAVRALFRVMAPGGSQLRVSVPDLETTCSHLLRDDVYTARERFSVMRIIFGGQNNPYDFHYVGFYMDFLDEVLRSVGFVNVTRAADTASSEFDDSSHVTLAEDFASLTVVAIKP